MGLNIQIAGYNGACTVNHNYQIQLTSYKIRALFNEKKSRDFVEQCRERSYDELLVFRMDSQNL